MALINDLCEAAFFGLYESNPPSALDGYELVRQKDYDPEADRPLPFMLFLAGSEAKRRPQPGVFDVPLKMFVATSATDDPQGVEHEAAAGAALALINDKNTTKAAINAGGSLQVYDYFLEAAQTTALKSGEWETELALKVICQAV